MRAVRSFHVLLFLESIIKPREGNEKSVEGIRESTKVLGSHGLKFSEREVIKKVLSIDEIRQPRGNQ